MEPTVKLFKLVTGESIIGTTETNCEDLTALDSVTVSDPVLVTSMRYPKDGLVYETFVMQPWIALIVDSTIDIATKHILVTSPVKENVENQYLNYLDSEAARQQEPNIDLEQELGEAELDMYEQLMNEEFEEDNYGGDNQKPTYH